MTIYDSKEDVIKTIFLQFGFLSPTSVMITEDGIAAVLVMRQSSNAASQSLLLQWSHVCCYTFPLILLLRNNLRKFQQELALPTLTALAWLYSFLLKYPSAAYDILALTWKYSASQCQPSPVLVSVQCPILWCISLKKWSGFQNLLIYSRKDFAQRYLLAVNENLSLHICTINWI